MYILYTVYPDVCASLIFVYPRTTTANAQNFLAHGVVVTGNSGTHPQNNNNNNNTNNSSFGFKIILFGGKDKDLTFRQTITEINVTIKTGIDKIQLINIDCSNFKENIVIAEKMIESNNNSLEKSNLNKDCPYNFGYECIKHKSEEIIIIIGGKNNLSNVIVWNYSNDEFSFINNVCAFASRAVPCVTLCGYYVS